MIIDIPQERQCFYCGKAISGRVDKRFCDDNCRNNYHYRSNKDADMFVNKVNNTLLHNRMVLKSLCCNAKTSVKIQILKNMGFDFNYVTALHQTKRNDSYKVVYDYAYKIIGDDVIVMRY